MNNAHGVLERAVESATTIMQRTLRFPRVAVVLGSGMGSFVDGMDDKTVIPYRAIPHFSLPTVAGHQGNLVVGKVGTAYAAVLQGRFHFYEGHDLETVTFPVRVMQALGVKTLVLTAATGGINTTFRAGDLMVLSDHLNLIGPNPLRGPNDDRLGTRFPDMSSVYSPRLREIAGREADRLGFSLQQGVYACMSGPSYETPAEIRMLRTLGADVVGMSTVPESIVARHAGMDVLAFALVTNAAAGMSDDPITHEEVLEAGKQAGPRLARLIEAVLQYLPSSSV